MSRRSSPRCGWGPIGEWNGSEQIAKSNLPPRIGPVKMLDFGLKEGGFCMGRKANILEQIIRATDSQMGVSATVN